MADKFKLHPDSGKFLLTDSGKFGVADACCCGGIILEPCTALCPASPPSTDCYGNSQIETTLQLMDEDSSVIGKVVKVNGKCYTVTENDITNPVAVTVSATYDYCEECCTDKPNIQLARCIPPNDCPHDDCPDEWVEDIIIPYQAEIYNAPYASTVKIDGRCWWKKWWTCSPANHAAILNPVIYADCDACCTQSLLCNGYEYELDSTVDFFFERTSREYRNPDWPEGSPVYSSCSSKRIPTTTVSQPNCAVEYGGVYDGRLGVVWTSSPEVVFEFRDSRYPSGDPDANCDGAWYPYSSTRLVQVRRDCLSGEWAYREAYKYLYGQWYWLDWTPFNTGCKCNEQNCTAIGDVGTDALGGSDHATYTCDTGDPTYYYAIINIDVSINVNNNPLP